MLVNNPKINVMEEVRKLIKKLEDGRRKRVEYRRRDNQGAKPMIIDRKIEILKVLETQLYIPVGEGECRVSPQAEAN